MQLICFQSLTNKSDSRYIQEVINTNNNSHMSCLFSIEHIELPIHIVPTVEATLSPTCVSALTHLPEILLEEEMESYFDSQEHCKDLLTSVHNTGGEGKTEQLPRAHIYCWFITHSVHAKPEPDSSNHRSASDTTDGRRNPQK